MLDEANLSLTIRDLSCTINLMFGETAVLKCFIIS